MLPPFRSVNTTIYFDTLVVEDSSPLITYAPAGAWIDTPNNDSLAAVSP